LNSAVFPGSQGGPLMHVVAAKALCFHEALQPTFKVYQTQVIKNAQALANSLIQEGLDIISGGTDNHLILVSLIKQNVTGKLIEASLGQAHITINKNAVPNDPQSPFVTSGMRLGSPAVTTRGFKEAEMRQIADWIMRVVRDPENAGLLQAIKAEVADLCKRFPVYAK